MKRRNFLSSLFALPFVAAASRLFPKSLADSLTLNSQGSISCNPPFKYDDSHVRYAVAHKPNGDFHAVPEIEGKFTFPAEWAGQTVALPLYRGEGETIVVRFKQVGGLEVSESHHLNQKKTSVRWPISSDGEVVRG